MFGLRQTATVYTEGGGGAFTVVDRTGLSCRLAHIKNGAEDPDARAELAARRNFIWDPAYELPQNSQIEVDGLRWNPVSTNAFEAYRGPTGSVVYRRCDVVRAS